MASNLMNFSGLVVNELRKSIFKSIYQYYSFSWSYDRLMYKEVIIKELENFTKILNSIVFH